MNRKLVKAKGTQLEIVRHLMKMNKKPIEIHRNMYKFVMKLIKILRLLLRLTRKKNAITITQNRIPIIWHLIKMNRNQY